jgi:hypothetical protein
MWWNLKIVRLEPQPNKNTKDEANKQKHNRVTSAETAADSDKMPKLTTSSHHIAKPNVGCCTVYFELALLLEISTATFFRFVIHIYEIGIIAMPVKIFR